MFFESLVNAYILSIYFIIYLVCIQIFLGTQYGKIIKGEKILKGSLDSITSLNLSKDGKLQVRKLLEV